MLNPVIYLIYTKFYIILLLFLFGRRTNLRIHFTSFLLIGEIASNIMHLSVFSLSLLWLLKFIFRLFKLKNGFIHFDINKKNMNCN